MMLSIRQTCIPRPGAQGELADAIFAASFGHVISAEAPGVYLDPVTFFRNTHSTSAQRHCHEGVQPSGLSKREGVAALEHRLREAKLTPSSPCGIWRTT